MKQYKIAVVPADGIGPEITREGVKVLDAVAKIRGYSFEYRHAEMGGPAFDKATSGMTAEQKKDIDRWADEDKTRLTLPQETLDVMDWARDNHGAVVFGSVGRSDLPKRTAELALLAMRKRYGVVNNRPMIIDPILAHNSILFRDPIEVPGFEVISPEESMFTAESYLSPDGSFSWTRKPFTRSKLEKTVTDAFEKAKATGRMIMCASKYNVLISEKMLSDVFEEVARRYDGQVKLNPNTNWVEDAQVDVKETGLVNMFGRELYRVMLKEKKRPTGQLIIDNAGMQIASNPEKYANTIVVADAMFGEFLQTIVDVVSGSVPVNKDALQQIREQGLYRTCIRELCSGLYFGERNPGKDFCFDTNYYDRKTIEDLAAVARRAGRQLFGKDDLDSLEIDGIQTYEFWGRVLDADSQSRGYALRHNNIRQSVARLLKDPASLNTVVACNMLGDIKSDLAGAVVGKSLGLLPSSSENPDGFGIYEQIAGTAPDIAGQNKANPIAQIRSCAMMLENFGDREGAQMIYRAITKALGVVRTKDVWEEGYRLVSTSEMGDTICHYLNEAA